MSTFISRQWSLGKTGDRVLEVRSQCEFKIVSASYSESPRVLWDSSYCEICSYRTQCAVVKDLSTPNLQDLCCRAKGESFTGFQWEVFLCIFTYKELKCTYSALFCSWTQLEKLCMIQSLNLILFILYWVLVQALKPSIWNKVVYVLLR